MFAHINFFMITPYQTPFMKRFSLLSSVLMMLLLVSCQKGLDYELAPDPFNPGGGVVDTSTTATNDGDLLVKILQEVTRGGVKESNTTTLSWDSNKRLKEYEVNGVSGALQVTARYRFIRASDGKVVKAIEDRYPARTNIDSVVHYVYYETGTDKIAYMVGTQYTAVGELGDSIVFTYNTNGWLSQKQVYYSIFGMSGELSKEEYAYDAKGNLTVQKMYSFDGVGYQLSTTLNYSYGSHKTPVQLGNEAFIVALASMVSPDYYSKYTQEVSGAIVLTSDYTQNTTFNSKDRPVKGTVIINGEAALFTCTYQ
jgi:hypothetical protein